MSSFVTTLLASLPFRVRTGHPATYDALHLVCDMLHPQAYLEIGVYDGASLLATLRSAPSVSRLILCDKFGDDWIHWGPGNGGAPAGSHVHIDRILSAANYHGTVEYLIGNSLDLIPTLLPSEPFDLILVDGDHSPESATADLNNSWPLLRPGGILVFDDSTRPQLRDVARLFSDRHAPEFLFEITDSADGTLAMRKTA